MGRSQRDGSEAGGRHEIAPAPAALRNLRAAVSRRSRRFDFFMRKIGLLRVAGALTAMVIGVLLLGAWLSHQSFRAHLEQDLKSVRLGARIALLDEVLTMSARMAVATGEEQWVRRYEAADAELELILDEAMSALPGDLLAFLEQTQAANVGLVEAERSAISFVRRGQAEQARDLVRGNVYEALKQEYSAGLTGMNAAIRERAERNLRRSRAWIMTSTVIAAAGLVISFAVFVTGVGRYRREHRLKHELAILGRRAAVERLAAGLVHEIGQPIAAIGHFADAGLETVGGPEPEAGTLGEVLRGIRTQVDRAAVIIGRTREFISQGRAEPAPVDLREVVRDAEMMVWPASRRQGVQIEVECDAGPMMVMGERVPLQQVFVNLLINAIDACSSAVGGGRVNITLTGDHQWIRARVIDNGPGIPAEGAEKVFDAFYSGKPDGMGLGLPISRDIVEFHGGWLHVEQVGLGACLSVNLPRLVH